jgi:DNA-binding transcriptional MerR regulator
VVLSHLQKGTEVRESIIKKAYYSIGEVCDLTSLKPHVLRYWETQFDILRPTKNRAGNRVFRPKDIELVLLVKNLLYAQKYTIEGANQKLLDMRKDGKLEGGQHEVLGPDFLVSMKLELEQLAKVLTPGEPIENLTESIDPDTESAETESESVETNPESAGTESESLETVPESLETVPESLELDLGSIEPDTEPTETDEDSE